jgi:hypothetical protein
LQFNSTNIDSDFNESSSSKSNQGDTTDNTNVDSSNQATNLRSTAATPAIQPNTSRTSLSTNMGQSTGRDLSGRLTSIMERRRSPDVLLKKWIKNQKIKVNDPDEPSSLTVSYSLFIFKIVTKEFCKYFRKHKYVYYM